MEQLTANVSWLAVIVGLVLSMGLGFVWFDPKRGPGRIWAEGVGVGLEPPENFPAFEMVTNTLGLFLVSWFVGVSYAAGLMPVAFLAVIAFAILMSAGAMFAQASRGAAMVSIGYWFLSFILMVLSQTILG